VAAAVKEAARLPGDGTSRSPNRFKRQSDEKDQPRPAWDEFVRQARLMGPTF